MRAAARRIVQVVLVVAAIPFLLDVPAAPSANAESLLAIGAAPGARVLTIDGLDPAERRHTVVAEAGDPEDPALVLIHGFGGSTFGWRQVMAPLAAEGWRVVAIDLLGFGLADKGWNESYDHRTQAGFVLAVMDRLKIDRAVFAGHSMGGNVVAWIAALAPERVRGLALIDAAIVDPTRATSGAASGALNLPPLRRAARIAIRSAFSEATFGELLRSAFAVTSAATPETIRGYAAASRLEDWDLALLGIMRDASANALPMPIDGIVERADAPIPTLILWGANDSWVPLTAGDALHTALPSAAYVVLPGLGHVPFEEDPEAFIAAVGAWLSEVR